MRTSELDVLLVPLSPKPCPCMCRFGADAPDDTERYELLYGRPPGAEDPLLAYVRQQRADVMPVSQQVSSGHVQSRQDSARTSRTFSSSDKHSPQEGRPLTEQSSPPAQRASDPHSSAHTSSTQEPMPHAPSDYSALNIWPGLTRCDPTACADSAALCICCGCS